MKTATLLGREEDTFSQKQRKKAEWHGKQCRKNIWYLDHDYLADEFQTKLGRPKNFSEVGTKKQLKLKHANRPRVQSKNQF